MQQNKIPDGQRTKVIYTLIKDAKYQDVHSILSRPLTTWATNFSSVQEVDPCHFLPTATIWAKISSIQLEYTNSFQSSTLKSPSTNFTSPKVTTKMEIMIKPWKWHSQLMIQPLSKKWFFFNLWSDTSKMRFSMPNHFFVKVTTFPLSQSRRFRYRCQWRLYSLQRRKILRSQSQVCRCHECDRIWLRNCIQYCSLSLQTEAVGSISQVHRLNYWKRSKRASLAWSWVICTWYRGQKCWKQSNSQINCSNWGL